MLTLPPNGTFGEYDGAKGPGERSYRPQLQVALNKWNNVWPAAKRWAVFWKNTLFQLNWRGIFLPAEPGLSLVS